MGPFEKIKYYAVIKIILLISLAFPKVTCIHLSFVKLLKMGNNLIWGELLNTGSEVTLISGNLIYHNCPQSQSRDLQVR